MKIIFKRKPKKEKDDEKLLKLEGVSKETLEEFEDVKGEDK